VHKLSGYTSLQEPFPTVYLFTFAGSSNRLLVFTRRLKEERHYILAH